MATQDVLIAAATTVIETILADPDLSNACAGMSSAEIASLVIETFKGCRLVTDAKEPPSQSARAAKEYAMRQALYNEVPDTFPGVRGMYSFFRTYLHVIIDINDVKSDTKRLAAVCLLRLDDEVLILSKVNGFNRSRTRRRAGMNGFIRIVTDRALMDRLVTRAIRLNLAGNH